MFYETLDNPDVNAEDETGAETQRSKEARPVGIVLDDKTVIRYVDNTDPEDISKSKVAALSEEMCLSLEEMKKLSDYAERKMEQEAKEILGGNIKQDPIYTSYTSNTCKWCAYTDFCTNKIRNKEGFRSNTALKKTEFFEAIEKKDRE
jgi:ATP-dependent helicase/DNAse subunit B